EAWLAKRWIFSLTNDARAMAEYREPWPDGLEIPESEVMLLHDAQAEFLRAFERRALAAFSFGGERGEFSGAPKAKPSWNVPESLPDVEKLVGEVLRRQDGRDTADYD
ncbi:MAG: hypothetical protein LBV01_04325, partial [Deltaproteobacteria bacterium]|nr:hypothetical protein [Deltaproteobacteria bacterium]